MKNILHISDIHASNRPDKGNSDVDLKTISDKIADDLSKLPLIDTILITGDIANSGDKMEYDLFIENFLNPLLATIKLTLSRVIFVPGNHDSNRKKWKKSYSSTREHLCEHYTSNDVDEQLLEYLTDGFQPFSDFNQFKKNASENGGVKPILENSLYCAYDIDGVGIAGINTAWLAHTDDRNKIMIGEKQIKDLLKSISQKKQKIIIMHHPFDWLHHEDRARVFDYIYKSKINCIFFGHMHKFSLEKESRFDEDSVMRIQAGKLDLKEDGSSIGYTLMSLNDSNNFEDGTIYFRHWNEAKRTFEPWCERAKDGKLLFTLKNAVPFNPDLFFDICRKKKNQIDTDLICNVGLPESQQRKLTDVFVFPTITHDAMSMADTDEEFKMSIEGQTIDQLCLDEILSWSESLVFFGGENSGKTTLAKRIAIHFLNEQAGGNISQCFYYLDAKDGPLVKANSIEKKLLNYYFEDENDSSCNEKIGKKIKSSDAIILIDSCESLDTPSLNGIFRFISENPNPRYILCSQLSAKSDLLEKIGKIECKKIFKLLNVSGLKRTHIRKLFESWSPSIKGKSARVVSQAIQSITGAGMPSNPFVYTMLLSIKERKTTSFRTYIHEADLVENFIEIILEKHVFTASNDPQYKDLILFMGYIASLMQKTDALSISESDMARAVSDFNARITKEFSYNGYVTPLNRCGIIRKIQGKYSFSQICFFNYSLAYWFAKLNIKYSELEGVIHLIKYDKVFEYISAIKKNDSQLLEYLGCKVTQAWNNLFTQGEIDDYLSLGHEIDRCASHDLLDIAKIDIDLSFSDSNRTQKDADEELDRLSPLSTDAISDVKKIDTTEILPAVYFNELLSLYARVFRAAEHLMDADASAKHFSDIFNFYMKNATRHVREFDQNLRPMVIARLTKILDYNNLDRVSRKQANDQMHAFLNFAIAAIPNWTVAMMNSDFFNQRQLERMQNFRKKCTSNLEILLMTYSLCELEGIDVPTEIISQKYNKPHESSSLLIKIIEMINFNFSLSKKDKKQLEDYIKKILKDRKNKNLLINHVSISRKMLLNNN